MSEYVDSSASGESIDDSYPGEDDELPLDEEMEGEDEKDLGNNIVFMVAAGIIIAFFLWLFLGLWGYLQEMGYGHG